MLLQHDHADVLHGFQHRDCLNVLNFDGSSIVRCC